MDGRLLLCFLCWIVPLVCSKQTKDYVSNGVSGVRCTRQGHHCVSGMRCVNQQCVCPAGYKGNAQFECVRERDQLCYIAGEGTTKIRSYGGSEATVNLPCTYRATRFLVHERSSYSSCSVEVHVTPELQRDNYVVGAVHVSVGVTQPILQRQTFSDVMVTGSYNLSRVYNYAVHTSPLEVLAWGSASATVNDRQQRGIIDVHVDEGDNFVVLHVPACETRIKFRAYDSTRNIQGQLPGVSVAVPPQAEFLHEMGDYPYSLCGGGNEPKSLYGGRAGQLRLESPAQAVMWDILVSQRPPQFDNPKSSECERAMDLFTASEDKKAHLKACSFLITKKTLRSCVQNMGLAPIDVFNFCLSFQQRTSDSGACLALQSAANACRNQWDGPTKYSC